MVMARPYIESLYQGKCAIIEHQKVRKSNKSTGFEDVIMVEDEPCRLSFSTISQTANDPNLASSMDQVCKLFVKPELEIKPGSKIVVTQHGVTTEYKHSGKSAMHSNHQEIILDLFDGWA